MSPYVATGAPTDPHPFDNASPEMKTILKSYMDENESKIPKKEVKLKGSIRKSDIRRASLLLNVAADFINNLGWPEGNVLYKGKLQKADGLVSDMKEHAQDLNEILLLTSKHQVP